MTCVVVQSVKSISGILSMYAHARQFDDKIVVIVLLSGCKTVPFAHAPHWPSRYISAIFISRTAWGSIVGSKYS